MTTRAKLTDLQLVLLSNAAAREDGMLLPPPKTVRARGKTLEKALAKLLRLGLVEETAAAAPEQAWREEDGGRGMALRIVAPGRAALGLAEVAETGTDESAPGASEEVPAAGSGSEASANDGGNGSDADAPAALTPPGFRAGTKQLRLASYLGQSGGISIGELSHLLGWQPHTVRAALTGLRKKGYTVQSRKNEEGISLYSATPPAEAADDAA